MSNPIIRIPSTPDVEFVTALNELIAPPQQRTRIISRPGVDGQARKKEGVRGSTLRLTLTRDVLTTGIAAFRSLIGGHAAAVVSFVDSLGVVWPGLHVDNVQAAYQSVGTHTTGIEAAGANVVWFTVVYEITDLGTEP